MSSLFRREDAIILGIMQNKYFSPPTQLGGGYNASFGTQWGFVLGGIPNTGAGGGVKGETGKARTDDSTAFSQDFQSISGSGGTQEAVGKGYQEGQFGLGGGTGGNSISCGGGGGWYGGGASHAGAGGGGGSGYVYVSGAYMPEYYYPPDAFRSSFGGAGLQTGVNEGHGKVIVNGIWEFNYTGKVQRFFIPSDGIYKIECFGAQGGGLNGIPGKYAGGLGGYACGEYYFPAGLDIYFYIGEQGKLKSNERAWNGGGMGGGGYYGGGGATDVRYSGVDYSEEYLTNFLDRFLVAGGGGGQGRESSDIIDLNSSIPPNVSPSGSLNEKEIVTEEYVYVVNDLTVCTVDLTYQTTLDLPAGASITVTLVVDGVERKFVSKVPTAGSGHSSFVFNFSDWMPEGSPERWVTLKAKVDVSPSDLTMIIPPKGLVISLSTKRRQNDIPAKDTDKPKLSFTRNAFNIDLLTYIDVYRMDLEHTDSPTVGDPDRIVDIVVIEDFAEIQKVSSVYSTFSDSFGFTDTADLKRVTVLRHDNASDSFEVRDVYLIEGGTKPVPNLDTMIEELGLQDFYIIDTSDAKLQGDLDGFGMTDLHSITSLGVTHHAEVDSFNVTDVYFIEGGNKPAPELDGFSDNYEILDFFKTNVVGVNTSLSLSGVEVSDIFTLSKVRVSRVDEFDSVSVSDVYVIDLN